MEVDNGIVSLKSIVPNWQKAIKNKKKIYFSFTGSHLFLIQSNKILI